MNDSHLLLVLIFFLLYTFTGGSRQISTFKSFSNELANELTQLRSNPATYAKYLEERLTKFQDEYTYLNEHGTSTTTQEGQQAVRGAIEILRSTPPSSVHLQASPALEKAAKIHAVDIFEYRLAGHAGSDGSSSKDRIERYGQWYGQYGESIHFDSLSARNIIIDLLIDDNAAGSRSDRENLLRPQFRYIGAVVGPHKLHTTSCVIIFADIIRDIDTIETKPRKLMLRAGGYKVSQEFAKVINSIPGEPRYIDNVTSKLRDGFEVHLDYEPEQGKAHLLFKHPKTGFTSNIDINFSLNAAVSVSHTHHAHDHNKYEDEEEVKEKESHDSFIQEALSKLWPLMALCGFTVGLAAVAWVVSEIVKKTQKLQQKKRI